MKKTIGYFKINRERMRYADFRNQGLFVGYGVIEAGCKTIIRQQLKQSGGRQCPILDEMDGEGSECDHCPPLLPNQQPMGGILGKSGGKLKTLPTNLSHTRGVFLLT